MNEFELIRRYFSPPTRHTVLAGGDDAALIAVTPGMELAVSTDVLVAGRHFPDDTEPYDVGYKSMAVNLSDMAAMGARPRWVTLSLTLPEANERWLDGFASGFLDLARVHYEAALANLGNEQPPLSRPVLLAIPQWDGALGEAYAASSDLAAARVLIDLAREVDPDARQQVELLSQKIEALAAQEAVAVALTRSRRLLEQGRFDEALAALDAGGPDAEREPRIQRQRALLLLRLERFDESLTQAEQIHTIGRAVASGVRWLLGKR